MSKFSACKCNENVKVIEEANDYLNTNEQVDARAKDATKKSKILRLYHGLC